MEQGKENSINNSTIKVFFGNILHSKAEVIVNSSGSKMTMGEETDSAYQVRKRYGDN